MAASSVLDAHSSDVDGELYWYYEYLIRKSPTKTAPESNLYRHYISSTAERDGESGGSSAQDELGMDMDPSHLAGSPDSPSSSGKQPENPLLLLGQYSDDELDEESSKRLDHATEENSIVDNNEQHLSSPETWNETLATRNC